MIINEPATYFELPSLTRFFTFNMYFIDLFNRKTDYFRPNIHLYSICDIFPFSNCDNLEESKQPYDRDYMLNTVKLLTKNNLSICWEFPDNDITKDNFKKNNWGYYLEITNNDTNSICVVSETCEKFIRKNYPKFSIKSAVCKNLADKNDLIRELRKDYKSVIVNPYFNNKLNELENIPYKEKCELVLNPCLPDQKFYRFLETSDFIWAEDIWTVYSPMGYSYFKIDGNYLDIFNLLETYLFYFVKKDWQDVFRLDIISDLKKMGLISSI